MLQIAATRQNTYVLQDSDVGKTLAHADRSRKVWPHDVGRIVSLDKSSEGSEVWAYHPATVTRENVHGTH